MTTMFSGERITNSVIVYHILTKWIEIKMFYEVKTRGTMKLSWSHYRILSYLATWYSVRNPYMWPSQGVLADRTGMDRNRLSKLMLELAKVGILNILKKAGTSYNHYQFTEEFVSICNKELSDLYHDWYWTIGQKHDKDVYYYICRGEIVADKFIQKEYTDNTDDMTLKLKRDYERLNQKKGMIKRKDDDDIEVNDSEVSKQSKGNLRENSQFRDIRFDTADGIRVLNTQDEIDKVRDEERGFKVVPDYYHGVLRNKMFEAYPDRLPPRYDRSEGIELRYMNREYITDSIEDVNEKSIYDILLLEEKMRPEGSLEHIDFVIIKDKMVGIPTETDYRNGSCDKDGFTEFIVNAERVEYIDEDGRECSFLRPLYSIEDKRNLYSMFNHFKRLSSSYEGNTKEEYRVLMQEEALYNKDFSNNYIKNNYRTYGEVYKIKLLAQDMFDNISPDVELSDKDFEELNNLKDYYRKYLDKVSEEKNRGIDNKNNTDYNDFIAKNPYEPVPGSSINIDSITGQDTISDDSNTSDDVIVDNSLLKSKLDDYFKTSGLDDSDSAIN